MSWKKFRMIKYYLHLSQLTDFLKKLFTPCKKFFIHKSLPERFKNRLPFQRCSFLILELSIKWKFCMRHLALRPLFTAVIKAVFWRMLIVNLETNIFFTPKPIHFSAMLTILSAKRSFLTSEFMM